MQEQLVKKATARLAKEKGFDWETEWAYQSRQFVRYSDPHRIVNWNNDIDVDCSAPTQASLQNWLREKHNIFVQITVDFYRNGINYLWQVLIYDKEDTAGDYCSKDSSGLYGDDGEYPTYEKALESGLKKALKRIK